MDQTYKDRLLAAAKERLAIVQEAIIHKLKEVKDAGSIIKERIYKLPPSEVLVQRQLFAGYEKKAEELEGMHPSPYFIKCEVKFDGEGVSRIFYFSKFSFPEQEIYSWTSPAAVVRFEKPGRFHYAVKGFRDKHGELLAKEQYMITGGKIIFMAAESMEFARELIYQEYFSQRKSSFLLPEIVEQMEQAQDKVIRAFPFGSFLVSGPAGSGKTTLALHRVAFLVQSPDTADVFKEQNSIVFVHDASTRDYFSQLLPQLGINHVTITTFGDWAREHLKLWDVKVASRLGNTELEKDVFEYEKNLALKSAGQIAYDANIFAFLEKIYQDYFSNSSWAIFRQQRKHMTVDRFDLTLLMRAYLKTNKGLFQEETEYKQLKGGKIQRKKILLPIHYSLMVLDEVQNYLPEQVSIMRGCLDEKNHSLVYVGDLAQQTHLGTIRNWNEVGEIMGDDRKVVLQKNYRSTKQIAEYIAGLGYAMSVPTGLREGREVVEKVFNGTREEMEYVSGIVNGNQDVVIGILAKSPEPLDYYKSIFVGRSNIHVLTIAEAQGVEFDIVCLVGIAKEFFSTSSVENRDLVSQINQVNKDLIYVGLTRAMNQLHVLGKDSLKDIIALFAS